MIRKMPIRSAQSGERAIALNKRFYSLSVQLLVSVFLSLIAAFVFFAAVFTTGSVLLDQMAYGKGLSDLISDRQFKQLQNYVLQNNITEDSIHRLNVWCSRGNGIYLTIYQNDNTLIFESFAVRELALDPDGFDPVSEDFDREYKLTFSDGKTVRAFLYYFASDAFFFWMLGISGLLSFGVFCICFVSFIHHKLRYIMKLRNELGILAGGDLDHPITIHGRDELSELAYGIDEMRRSIQSHQQAEDEIRSANSQLVTSMSHDLRTPLTSLLAYLELLDREKVRDEEQRRHLINQCLAQTLSIRSMAEKLFEYSLAYTSEWEQPDMEVLDADEVFLQSWQEYTFSLESRGFSVETDFRELKGTIRINSELLRRAFDNLYSNLVKYSDPSQPVHIAYFRDNGQIILTLSNVIADNRSRRESTNIGLNTCRRILKLHNGSFVSEEESGSFCVTVQIPVYNTTDKAAIS